MTRLPLPLRLFWIAFFTVTIGFTVGLPAGPAIETWLSPVRSPGARVESVGRNAAWVWFDWRSRKRRLASSPGVDATMFAHGDVFDLTLFNDESLASEPRCTRVIPWARSRIVGVGSHLQPYCVEIPRTVVPADPIDLDITAKYRGFSGLWVLRVPFPHVSYPGSVTGSRPASPTR